MIQYTVKHHVPGRIRIQIPGLKKMGSSDLRQASDIIQGSWMIEGIRDVCARPATGSLTIKYDPSALDINAYLARVASDERIEELIMARINA